MDVTGQGQIDAQPRMIEELGIVDQQNVDRIWHYQSFELLQSLFALYLLRMHRDNTASVVYPDQIENLIMHRDSCSLLAQDADTLGGEQPSDGVFNPRVRLVISKAPQNPVRRLQACQHTNHLILVLRLPTDV